MDADAASLSTCMLSISFMLREFRVAVVGTPSIMKRGSCEALKEPIPLILTEPVPLGEPLAVIVIPGTFPWRARIGSVSADVSSDFVDTTDTAPVRSALRTVW